MNYVSLTVTLFFFSQNLQGSCKRPIRAAGTQHIEHTHAVASVIMRSKCSHWFVCKRLTAPSCLCTCACMRVCVCVCSLASQEKHCLQLLYPRDPTAALCSCEEIKRPPHPPSPPPHPFCHNLLMPNEVTGGAK